MSRHGESGGNEWLRSARRFSMALRAARAGAWEWEMATGVARWSPENYLLMGLEPGDGVARYDDWLARVHPEDRERAEAEVSRAVETQGELDFEYRAVWPDGTERWLRDVGTMLFGDDGEPIGMYGIQIDVTERRALEEEVRLFQRMEALGRVAGAVAHDFNNLLTIIRGYTELLRERAVGEEAEQMLDETLRATDKAARLTRQLLAFGRRQVLHPRSLRLDRLVESRRELLRQTVGESVALRTTLDSGCGPVWADESQLELVLLNLVVNAADAMPGGGALTIGTAEVAAADVEAVVAAGEEWRGSNQERWVSLWVQDTGAGMDAATRARIFEPFFTTKPADRGTGLGLASVYGIVRQSGGAIGVDSEPGQGSRFTIYLPRA